MSYGEVNMQLYKLRRIEANLYMSSVDGSVVTELDTR